jgi:energy-coupling factor transport system permease protein
VRAGANPVVWGVWGLAITLVTVTTRDPLYLALALLATTIVYLTRTTKASDAATWSLVVRIGALVSIVSVIFILLTAHAGDTVLVTLPGALPIVGGIVTANALAYGVSTALSITTLIVAAATFGSMVDRASLMRAVPYPLSSVGVAAIIGLSFFPQMIVAFRDVRDAQASRGFQVRSVRDVVPLVVPTLFLGLEHAFNLAEAMESRGFGATLATDGRRAWLLPVGVGAILLSVALLIGGQVPAAALVGALGAGATFYGLFGVRSGRQAYRPLRWTLSDWVVLTTSAAGGVCFAGALVFASHTLVWSPFPRLNTPPFAPWLGVACLLLVAPAFVESDPA